MASWSQQGRRYGRREGCSSFEEAYQPTQRYAPMPAETYLLSSASLRNSQAHAQYSIGSQLSLVLRTVQLDQELVNFGLILDVKSFFENRRSNDFVNVGDSLGYTLAIPFRLISIAQFAGFVLACRGTLESSSVSLQKEIKPIGAVLRKGR